MVHFVEFEYEISKSCTLTGLVTGTGLILHVNLMGNEEMSVKGIQRWNPSKITFSGHSLGLNISITQATEHCAAINLTFHPSIGRHAIQTK